MKVYEKKRGYIHKVKRLVGEVAAKKSEAKNPPGGSTKELIGILT